MTTAAHAFIQPALAEAAQVAQAGAGFAEFQFTAEIALVEQVVDAGIEEFSQWEPAWDALQAEIPGAWQAASAGQEGAG